MEHWKATDSVLVEAPSKRHHAQRHQALESHAQLLRTAPHHRLRLRYRKNRLNDRWHQNVWKHQLE